jgi:anti-sigma factor RsiW
MTCLEFTEAFDSLVDAGLSAALSDEMRAHMHSCPDCASYAASITALDEQLKAVQIPEAGVEFQAALASLAGSLAGEASRPSFIESLTPAAAVLIPGAILWGVSGFLPLQAQMLIQSLIAAAGIAAAAMTFLKPRMLSVA